jgi:hypothetical protein
MNEKMNSLKFMNDINDFRANMKKSFELAIKLASKENSKNDEGKLDLNSDSLSSSEIMVLPIEWRSKISFEQKPLDSKIDLPFLSDITLEKVEMLRSIISDVLLDVLLYMDSRHHADMIKCVINELNRVYSLFIERNPDFIKNGGQVHIYAHSLGSLICLDILSNHSLKMNPFYWQKTDLRNHHDREESNENFNKSMSAENQIYTEHDSSDSPVDLSDLGPLGPSKTFVLPT